MSFRIATGSGDAGDASFAFQPVNHKYNPFWRSVATSLFYVRTGVNLGFGAPVTPRQRGDDGDSIYPLDAHDTPNHYVQETLANWLEFYVGRLVTGDRVSGDGLSRRVLRGDLTGYANDGAAYVPLSTLMAFLEDWYACACLEFVKSAFDPDAHKALMDSYVTTVKDMIAPHGGDAAFDAATAMTLSDRVQAINHILRDQFPAKSSRSKAFVPQLVLLRGAPGSRTVRVDGRSSVARGTAVVALPPDAALYDGPGSGSGAAAASHPDTVVMDEAGYDLEDLFQPDRMFVVDGVGCLFALEGHPPSFVHRGYMKRVTEGVLRDILPTVSSKQTRELLATVYVGGSVDTPISASNDKAETLELVATPSDGHAFSILTFRGSAWRGVAGDWATVLAFLTARRFVVEDGRDMYLAAPSKPSHGGAGPGGSHRFRAAARLHAVDDAPDRFVAEVTTHRLSASVEDFSGIPNVAVFLSGADAASLAFKASERVADAFSAIVTSRRRDVKLSSVFGDPDAAESVLEHKSSLRLGDGQGLASGCVTYVVLDGDVAASLTPSLKDVDSHTKYSPCLEVDGSWFVGHRDEAAEAEAGDDIISVPDAARIEPSASDPAVFERRSGSEALRVDADDVACTSSSLQRGVLFNYLHLSILRAYADEPVKAAFRRLVDAARPLSGTRGELRDRLETDADTLRGLLV